MKNYSYHKKYHYLLKYFIMAFPLICYILCYFIRFSELEVTSQGEIAFESFMGFADVPINSWYTSLLDILQIPRLGSFDTLLVYYPLYILWVYIMDLILDIFALVPKLAHKLLYKLGGGIND